MNWKQRLKEIVVAGGTLASAACSSASSSSGTVDAGGSDSAADTAVMPDVNMCCNANPDPCCVHMYCGEPISTVCQSEMDCQADGGTWNSFGSNFNTCSFEAGAGDSTAPPGDSSVEPDAHD